MTALIASKVRVPCSTSNLGSGFDTLGLALDRYLTASFEPGPGELVVRRSGTVARLDHDPPGSDLLVETFASAVRDATGSAPTGLLSVHSLIPLARGLGSSSAALVAGHDLARAVLGRPPDPLASFRHAFGREGHGDNAAPCALGGLRAVVPSAEGARPLSLELSPEVGFAYAAPSTSISTAAARASLPEHVPHAVAVAELGRLAALVRGLALADADLIRVGIEDALHVPYRLPLIPRADEAVQAGYEAGAWSITISGSGSGLIATCDPDDAPAVSRAMQEVFSTRQNDPDCVAFELHPDFEGLTRPDVEGGAALPELEGLTRPE